MQKQALQELLGSVGIFPHYLGCAYFTEAVLMAAEQPERLVHIQEEIYLPIARRHHVSQTSVERDIRTVRDVMMKHGGAELLCRLTGSPCWKTRVPYPRELISIFSLCLSHLS